MPATLDHVALLVESHVGVPSLAARLDLELGGVQIFPQEGTREQYAGSDGERGRLLFIEPVGDGPYRRAMRRRGPGLHHVAIAVADLERYVEGLAGSGWYMLPQSLATIREARTAWLARPDMPCLVEISEARPVGASLISKFELPNPTPKPALVEALQVEGLVPSPDRHAWVTLRGARLRVDQLLD